MFPTLLPRGAQAKYCAHFVIVFPFPFGSSVPSFDGSYRHSCTTTVVQHEQSINMNSTLGINH